MRRPACGHDEAVGRNNRTYTAAEGGEKFDFAIAINKDTVLYAHWTKNAQPKPVPVTPSDKGSSKKGSGEIPDTGDTANVAALGMIAAAGAIAAGLGIALKKRQN